MPRSRCDACRSTCPTDGARIGAMAIRNLEFILERRSVVFIGASPELRSVGSISSVLRSPRYVRSAPKIRHYSGHLATAESIG